jgi:hypothetical protein
MAELRQSATGLSLLPTSVCPFGGTAASKIAISLVRRYRLERDATSDLFQKLSSIDQRIQPW